MTGIGDASGEVWTVEVEADTSALQSELRVAASLGRQFSNSLVSAFDGIAVKGRSVGDVLKSLTARLSDLVVKAAFQPLEKGVGDGFASLLSGSLGFAKGAAFQGKMPVPFANGGVIQSPIAFPMGGGRMGIAGERGAEAIMPLSRGPDGRLGVAATRGSGMQITFNVAATDAESFRRSESQISAMLARAAAMGQRNL